MSFTIASIFIHDQIDYTMVSFYKGCRLDHIKTLEFMIVNSSDSAFPGGSGKILPSDPASPPLAPLSTKEPCLACDAVATW